VELRVFPNLSRFFLYFAGFALAGLAGWVESTFDHPTIEQILFHLYYSERVAMKMSHVFLLTFMGDVVVFPLLFAVIAALVHIGATRLWPASARWPLAVPGLVLVAGLTAVLLQLSAFSYAAALLAPDRFAQQYVEPSSVRLVPGKPRNLVLIYVESMEEAYGDTARFAHDLLAPIRAAGGESFAAYRQVPGVRWTIAGIVATQCGVPLRIYSERDMKNADKRRTFLPGAVCLGDILQAHGYRNVFLGGAPLSFAGKGAFLRDHGYQEVHGRNDWKKAGARTEEFSEWGLYDSGLFERARAQLESLEAGGRPFNLTLLTLDTHNPRGYLSPYCRGRGAREFEDIVSCTSEQLAAFVKFMRDKGYLKNTVVVMQGDHLAVPNPVYDKLQQGGERHIFNRFFLPKPLDSNTDELVHFDLFPTLLDLLGMKVVGGRLGLGYSAVGGPAVPRPANRLENLDFPTLSGSAQYKRLWRETRPKEP
jgi:phosphoglycerol transferase